MKVGMISLGCPKNLVDSEVMLGLAQQSGHELTQDAGEADVLIVLGTIKLALDDHFLPHIMREAHQRGLLTHMPISILCGVFA